MYLFVNFLFTCWLMEWIDRCWNIIKSWHLDFSFSISRFGCWRGCANWRTKLWLWGNHLTGKNYSFNPYLITMSRITNIRLFIVSMDWSTQFCSARRVRVRRVREILESSLSARIELIESYAKVGIQRRTYNFFHAALHSN